MKVERYVMKVSSQKNRNVVSFWITLLLISGQVSAADVPKKIRIDTIGDSITHGMDATNAYRAELQAKLLEDHGIQVEFVGSYGNCPRFAEGTRERENCDRIEYFNKDSNIPHDGIPGQKIEDLFMPCDPGIACGPDEKRFDHIINFNKPDVVTLMIGTNNIWVIHDGNIDDAKAKFTQLMDMAAKHPKVKFVVSTIPPVCTPEHTSTIQPKGPCNDYYKPVTDPTEDWGASAVLYNRFLKDFAQTQGKRYPNISFVDSYSKLTDNDLFAVMPSTKKMDHIHPNAQGEKKVGNVFARGVFQALSAAGPEGGAPAAPTEGEPDTHSSGRSPASVPDTVRRKK